MGSLITRDLCQSLFFSASYKRFHLLWFSAIAVCLTTMLYYSTKIIDDCLCGFRVKLKFLQQQEQQRRRRRHHRRRHQRPPATASLRGREEGTHLRHQGVVHKVREIERRAAYGSWHERHPNTKSTKLHSSVVPSKYLSYYILKR